MKTKTIFKNWKTTAAGIGAILTGVSAILSGNFVEGLSSVVVGLGLIFAKDGDVTGK